MSATETQTTLVPMTGGPGSPARRVGTVTLAQEQTYRRGYETAAWFQDVIVPAGATAELTTNGYYVFARFEGVKGASNFTSLYGGVPIGAGKVDEGAGEPDEYTIQAYAYGAAKSIVEGTFLDGATVTLDEGVKVTVSQFDHGEHGGLKFHYGFAVTA